MTQQDFANSILTLLHDAGFDAYLVGGSVRDFVMGRTPHDFDITTSARPEQMHTVFAHAELRTLDTGIVHGTVTVLPPPEERDPFDFSPKAAPVEVTTFRTDGSYSDHRHPDSVLFCETLREDLARRDFTVNAMATRPAYMAIGDGTPNEGGGYGDGTESGFGDSQGVLILDGEYYALYDPFGGQKDLLTRQIRAVGDPAARFEEDALRILRALRFASTLGFTVEPVTKDAIFAKKHLLASVSAERIYTELSKLLCGSAVESVLLEYGTVLAEVVPEIGPMIGFAQQSPHHCYDVWTHTAKVVASTPADPITRLAALLHDSGKPGTARINPEQRYMETRPGKEPVERVGRMHFKGHARLSTELAEAALERLKVDHDTRDAALELIHRHDILIPAEPRLVKRWLGRFGETQFFRLMDIKVADNLAQHPDFIADRQALYKEVRQMAKKILAEGSCFSLKDLAVNGSDLLTLGIPEGPEIGQTLQLLLNEVIDEKLPNDKAALLARITRIQKDRP